MVSWFKCCDDCFFLLQAAFGSRLLSCSSVSGKVFSCSSVSGKVLLSSTNEWKKSRNLLNLLRCTRGNSQFYLESLVKIYSSRRDEDDKRRMLLDAFNADLDQVTVFSQLAGYSFSSQVSMEMSLMMELTDNTHQYIVVHQASLRNRVSPKAKKNRVIEKCHRSCG